MIKILHITPDFNYSCGRSKLVYLFLKYFSGEKNYETHFITNGGDSIERLGRIASLKYEIMKFSTGRKNFLYLFNFYNKLKEYIVINKIDLIHTHHRFPEIVAAKIGKDLNVKTITSAHSFVKGYRTLSFKSDKVVSVSKSITNYLINNYKISVDRIITLYNPIEKNIPFYLIQAEKFKKENNITSEQKILLFIGRINFEKGSDKLLEAFNIITKKNDNVLLILNGQVDDKKLNLQLNPNYKKIIYQAPLNNNSFLYSISDIVVLPSRVDPFPFVMIEAGAFKKPFIGGNVGGIAEFIEDKVDGILVDPENHYQLAEKIIYLLNNPEKCELLGKNLYEKVNKLCDYNNYFNQIEKIYTKLVSSE